MFIILFFYLKIVFLILNELKIQIRARERKKFNEYKKWGFSKSKNNPIVTESSNG